MKKFTRLLFFGFLLTLLSFTGMAQNSSKITSVVGKLVRITPKLSDIDVTSMYGKPFVITRDKHGIIGFNEEAEERVERQILKANKNNVTGGLQNRNTPSPSVPITTLGVNFDGLAWQTATTGIDPSDNNMAAGPNHVIQIVNNASGSQFKIWNKSGAVVQNGTVLASLTGLAGLGDPIVLYDQLANRWMISEFGPGGTTQNYLTMAVSVTADPTGAWKIYQYTDNSFFPDYPKYSVWHNAYYATTNDFPTGAGSYLGSSIWAFDRTAMLAGAATATMVRFRQTAANNMFYNMGTVGLEGTTPSTQSGLFAVPNGSNVLNLFEFTPNFTTPASSVVGPLIPLPITTYGQPPSTAAQQGSGSTIQTLGSRLMFKLNYRNNAGTESIVIAHTVAGSPATLAAVRWYELRRVAGNWTVYQQGTVTGADGNSRFLPSISMDALGNIALMYDVSGTSAFPSIRYTARNQCDPLDQMTLPEQTIINGTAAHTWSQRWGDYNTLTQDPANGSFWCTSQYSAASFGSTRIANFTVSGGAASFTTQPANTTVCAGTIASFTAAAAGNPPITYQWQVSTNSGTSWTDISGATAATYSFTAAAGDNGKQFRSVATSSCGAGNSNAATLTITTLSQGGNINPATTNACAGVNSTTLTLAGSIGNIIRWESSIDGGTTWTTIANTTTTLTATNITQTTLYRAYVQSSGCTATYSATSTLTFLPAGVGTLTILADNGTTLCAGDPTLLTAVGLTTFSFSNTGTIAVPGSGSGGAGAASLASPYPSNVTVSGLPVAGVPVTGVTISGITHTWESDISIVLQSPTGQNVILMSSVTGNENGGFGILNKTFTFSDAAAAGLVAGSPNGTYKPTNNSTTRTWPAPGPGTVVQGVNPLLSSFTGNPNGVWKLYAVDPVGGDFGSISGGYSITFASTGVIPGLTYSWSPALGLNATNTNPVAASPAVSTTYTVVATSGSGCTGTASIAITVNQRPKVTVQPLNVSVCEKSAATFSVTATGTGISYQWQESTNGGTSYTNLANGTPYSGVGTATLSVNPTAASMNNNLYRCVVSGICTPAATSTAAKLTTVALPAVTVTPASGCGGLAGTNGLLLTASGAASYTWSPAVGLYTNATTTTGYTAGSNVASVYAAPTTFTIYTVTGTSATTGCSSSATAVVNYTPTAPLITPAPVTMCLGDAAVMLTKALPKTLNFSSGAISVAVPDNSATGAISTLAVAGVPAGATITEMKVTWTMPHTWNGDMVFALKAPNGNILNLDYYLSNTGGTGATTGFVNTTVSSTGTAALSSGSGTYTGTFKADAATGAAAGPTGYTPNVTNFSSLYSTPSGTYTLAMYDGGGGDVGTLTSWSLGVTYQVGLPSTPPVWSPISGLFLDPAALIPYNGTPRDTVYTRPTPSGVYTYQAVGSSLPPAPVSATMNNTATTFFTTLTFNVRNNNNYAVTLTDISSMCNVTGATAVSAYYKTAAVNGLPGAISTANGWNQFGSATITSIGFPNVQPFMSGLGLVIPAGATYGILVSAALPSGTGNLVFSNAGTNLIASGGGCDIITGTNIGYTGPAVPGAPTFTPYYFIGSIGVVPSVTACTSPATTVVVTVNQPITFTTQPVDAAVCTDKVTSFTAVAAGSVINHNWKVSINNGNTWADVANGGVYAGAKTGTLTITAPPVSMSGYLYKDSVSTVACRDVSSNFVKLTVNPLPTIIIAASPYKKLFPGLKTTIFSTVTPAAGTYTWFKNGAAVANATAGSLLVDVDGIGEYTLRVTDINGCTNSSNLVSITDSVSGRVFIYPNPNGGQFQVRYYSIVNNTNLPRGINIYDARGKRVATQTYAISAPYARMNVDLTNQGTGVYWIEVVDVVGNRLAMGRAEVLR